MGSQNDGSLLQLCAMTEKHGMTLFRQMASEFDKAIQNHDVQELERLGRVFIAEITYKSKKFSVCGTKKTDAKRAAAITNGGLGGRPPKTKR